MTPARFVCNHCAAHGSSEECSEVGQHIRGMKSFLLPHASLLSGLLSFGQSGNEASTNSFTHVQSLWTEYVHFSHGDDSLGVQALLSALVWPNSQSWLWPVS